MNWQEFEEGLKSGVNNHNSNIDTDQLWNNIQEKKRRKRPFLFWWWTGGALLLTAGTAIAIYFMQYHNVHIKNNITTQELSISTDNITTKNELQRVSTTKLSYDVQPENHNEKNVATTTTTNILHTQASTSVLDPKLGDKRVAPQGSNTAVASTLPVINALSPVRTNKQDASIPNSNPVFNPNILDNAGGINPINKREKGEENTPLAAVTLSLTTASSAELASNTNIVSDHINVPKTVVNTVLATNLLQTEEFPQKNITQSSNFPLLPIRSPLLEAAPKQYDFPWFNPETTKKKQPEQQSFYGGISSGYYRWAAFRAVGVDSVLKSPRTNERNLEAVNLGLQFFLPFHKKWTLSTGVQYESYNSVYNWKNQWVNNSTPTPITTSYINGEQDSTTIYTRTTTTRIVEHYNKITTFAIPLELGYRIQRGKWGIMPFAGVQIALQQRAKGVISSLDNVPQANIYPSIYRRTLVCSAHAGVRIHVALSAKTQLLLSPVARYDLTNRAVGFNERIGAVGLQMGVVRKF